jgi:hypothetical protein
MCLIIYLDESGDLGVDFENKQPSRYFVIVGLVCKDAAMDKQLQKAISRTIKNKLGAKENELKGTKTELKIKIYFLAQLHKLAVRDFKLYAVIVDKRKLLKTDTQNKSNLYNQVTGMLLQQITTQDVSAVTLIVDKSKNKYGMKVFDDYIKRQLSLPMPFFIHHYSSSASRGLQAVDLFSWGIYRKYEHQDTEWYQAFESTISYEKEC